MADLDVHAERRAADHVTEELEQLRSRIDELDETIVEALAERFELSRQTAGRKGGAVQDPAREADVLAHVAAVARRAGLDPEHVVSLYGLVLRISVEIQGADGRNHLV